jgi:hypothetical protein
MRFPVPLFPIAVWSAAIVFPVRGQVRINEIQTSNAFTVQDEDGECPDWIEIRNAGDGPADLDGWGLSDDPARPFRWIFPAIRMAPQSHRIVFASGKDRRDPALELHANFKLDSDGEILTLTRPDGSPADSMAFPPMPPDVSFGRPPGASGSPAVFEIPTPGAPNGEGFGAFASNVAFSPDPGFYAGPADVVLRAGPGETVRYTLDGSDPGPVSAPASGPLRIASTAVLKARAFGPGRIPGPVAAATYFIGWRSSLPVVSVSTAPDFLFDDDIGIYVQGNGTATGGYPGFPAGAPANYFEDWERPAFIELFETGGARGFAVPAGIRIHGKTTRTLPQKSLAVHLRSKYGVRSLEYPLLPGTPVHAFKSFLLRNAGSDNTDNTGGVQFRDGFAARLVGGLDLEAQAYRPCVLFLNGEYWGVIELREHQDAHYLESHGGADPDAVDILDDYHRLRPWVIEGDAETYDRLIDFLERETVEAEPAARYVRSIMDVDNYLTYMAVQIYFANHDGPGHNCRFWRPRSAGGTFRWLLYDADQSFGMRTFVPSFRYNPEAYNDNTIAYYREENGPAWPNPPESTFLFRKILENPGFRNDFVNRVADLLNTVFLPDTVLRKLAEVRDAMAPEMGRHLKRWGGSIGDWEQWTGVIDTFAVRRPSFLRGYTAAEFGTGESVRAAVSVLPEGGGTVSVNSIRIASSPWTGLYFRNVPVKVRATPNPGYRFAGWSGALSSSDSLIEWRPDGGSPLVAEFAETTSDVRASVFNPAAIGLGRAYPNPFNGTVRIPFSAPEGRRLLIEIRDSAGRRVRVLDGGPSGFRREEAVWDGTDSAGRPVPSGVYVFRIADRRSGPPDRRFTSPVKALLLR